MEPMQIITETILVKGAPDVEVPVRITRHGPLISDASNANSVNHDADLEPLALRWTALDGEDATAVAFLGINEACNWAEFVEALRSFVVPAQNIVYADVDGNIGYYAPGRVPIRASGDGSVPADGRSGAQEWTGWVPFEAMPHALNPPDHYLATANNRPVPDDYPFFLGREWAEPYRAQRIVDLIKARGKLTVDDHATIQADTVSLHARELLPLLVPLVTPSQDVERQALGLLKAWDGDMRGDSPAGAIFQAWFVRLVPALTGDELGLPLAARFAARFPFVSRFLGETLRVRDNPWCDDVSTPQRETCDVVAASTLRDALSDLGRTLEPPLSGWRWDRLHWAIFPHQGFDGSAVLGPFLSRRVPNGGDWSTVNVGPFSFARPFEQRSVASYRQIVDLANLDASRFIQAGGQSGHPLSPHYDDYLEDWRAVKYRPMRFERVIIERERLSTLRLEPSKRFQD